MSQPKDANFRAQDALDYHEFPKPGKLQIEPTKPLSSQRDLSMAYSPGVAQPCLAIADNPTNVFRYTNKGNLVGVVTNGSATLGLGNIGGLASKPVMEGKAVLFKSLADVDAFDIELNLSDPDAFVQCVHAMEPTFGGINLEDIAAPDCFYIEEQLRQRMNIPVFHDDQHGTAIITGAALKNALELQEKDISTVRVVFAGAGAAGIACARLYVSLGVKREHITMVDIDGVVYKGRDEHMHKYLEYFAQDTDKRTLAEAFVDADVFVGVSAGGIVSKEMVATMAPRPIIFALANPEPEIRYEDVLDVRSDAIVASGRSDYPNQVNNVLCFPFIFRGALDVGAKAIDESMKIAAVDAIAQLAREDVPDVVQVAYGGSPIRFGPEYIIPKPFDPRALIRVASAVGLAASNAGLAQMPIDEQSVQDYREKLERSQGASKAFVRELINKAKASSIKRIAFPEGDELKILKAAQILLEEKIAIPVLMGDEQTIRDIAREMDLSLEGVEIFDIFEDERRQEVIDAYYTKRARKGVTLAQARTTMRHREAYAMMLLDMGRVDGVVSGLTKSYSETTTPALEIIGVRKSRACGIFIMITRDHGIKFFADTTVRIDPTAEDLAEIAWTTAELAQSFDIKPRIAMLSYSNFGSSRHPKAKKVAKATQILKSQHPNLTVEGEMQVDVALDEQLRNTQFAFADLDKDANIFIFPDLNSGNISYKLLHQLGRAEPIGPILAGMRAPVNVLQFESSVSMIVNLTVITCLQADSIPT